MNLSIARERPELLRFFEKAPPLGRMGKVEDLTATLLLLLSDQASYITGIDIPIDGGMSVSASGWGAPIKCTCM
jgi:NAD(P)-dependent dehydrogenase (short-subunit alcohol dehydrogenase family)